MRINAILFLVFCGLTFSAQQLNSDILNASFPKEEKADLRPMLKPSKKWARYNPLTYIGTGLLFLYQNIISEQIQANCTYEISCSEYTKRAVSKLGLAKGVLSGFSQLSECFNGAVYEHPRMYISPNHKVINYIGNAE